MNKIKLLLTGVSLVITSTHFAQSWSELIKISAADADNTDNFGWDLATHEDYAIVGANNDDDYGTNAGSAYIFEKDADGNWVEVQKLVQTVPGAWDYYGEAVAIYGNYAVVGAHGDDSPANSGSAYVFERGDDGTWSEMQKLTASDQAGNDRFGKEVAVYEGYVVITATRNDETIINSGSVYIFELNDDDVWEETQILHASDPGANDNFGRSISIDADRMVLGAVNDDVGEDSGGAYIFELGDDGEWTETQKLTASDAAASDNFGHAVSMSGEYLVIGAYRDDDTETQSGSAYVFQSDEEGTWTEVQKLTASDPAPIDLFGEHVAMQGDYIVIGTSSDDAGVDAGSAYVFELNGDDEWEEIQKITASDAASSDYFSKGISVNDNQIMISAYFNDDGGTNAGCMYIFQRCDDLAADIPSTEACFGEEFTLSATSVNDAPITWTDDVINGTPFFPPLGETTYTATGGENDCELQVTLTVYESPTVEISATDSIVCDGTEITLIGTGAETYVWEEDIEDGVAFTPAIGETTYTVTGTNADGCEGEETITVTVNALPEVIALTTAEEICLGSSVTLNGDGAVTYSWDEGVTDGVAFEPPLGESTYTVIGTDANDCENTAEITITVNDLPIVIATADETVVCEGEFVTLTGTGAVSYDWTDGVENEVAFEPPVGTTTYFLTGTDDNDCAAMDSIVIEVNENPIVEIDEVEDDLICLSTAPIVLSGSPAEGTFSGSGVTDSFFDPTAAGAGTHTVYYSYENDAGCTATDSVEISVVDCLGIDDDNALNFTVYPNPFSAQATLSFNQELNADHQIVIYNIVGSEVYRNNNLNGTQLILTKDDLSQGVYLLVLMNKNERHSTTKLIVQ